MAVTIIKKDEVKAKAAVDLSNDAELLDLTEKMASLSKELAPMEASIAILQKDYAAAEKKALAILAKHGVDAESYSYSTESGVVEFGIVPNKTEITDEEALFEELEKAEEGLFRKLAKVGLGDLKKYLGEKTIEKFTKTFRAGKRRVKVTLSV